LKKKNARYEHPAIGRFFKRPIASGLYRVFFSQTPDGGMLVSGV